MSPRKAASSHVFLSYAHRDREHAERLTAALTEAGVTIWRDSSALKPGQDWEGELVAAIRNSAYFLVLLSEESLAPESYVAKEIRIASALEQELLRGEIFILPVRLTPVPHPDKLKHLQAVDLFPDWASAIKTLATALESQASAVATRRLLWWRVLGGSLVFTPVYLYVLVAGLRDLGGDGAGIAFLLIGTLPPALLLSIGAGVFSLLFGRSPTRTLAVFHGTLVAVFVAIVLLLAGARP